MVPELICLAFKVIPDSISAGKIKNILIASDNSAEKKVITMVVKITGKKESIPCQKAAKKSGRKMTITKIKFTKLKSLETTSKRIAKKIRLEKIEKNKLLAVFIRCPNI
jgi:hypothetical protein